MKPLKNVLIVSPYGLGDLLFITPIMRALKLIPSIEKVDLLLGSRSDVVVKNNPHIDRIYKVDKDALGKLSKVQFLKEIVSLGKELKKNKYDLMLDFSLRAEYAFFGKFFLGISKRAGFTYKRRGIFHNITRPLHKGFNQHHVTEFYSDLAEAAAVPVEDRYMEFYLNSNEIEEAESFLRQKKGDNVSNYIVISPGGGESWGKDAHFKRWPPHSFAEFVNKLEEHYDFDHVVILGTEKEKGLGEAMAKRINKKTIIAAGETNLNVSGAIIKGSKLFLGNDGGLVHIAHALKVPVIAWYGPVDPNVYGPFPRNDNAIELVKENLECRPCYFKFRYKADCEKRECLQELSALEAFSSLQSTGFLERLTNKKKLALKS